MIGALYWSRKGATPEWAARYPDQAALYPQGGFVVPAGDLGYSVTVFCVCAVLCLGTLTLRRSVLGGELGGPSWAAARDRSQGGGVAQRCSSSGWSPPSFFSCGACTSSRRS